LCFTLSKWCLFIYLEMNNLEEMIFLINIVGFQSMLSEFPTNTIVTRWPRCATFYIEISYFVFITLSCQILFAMNKCIWYFVITVFTVFRLLTDFVCLYNYEFGLSLCKIVRSSVILLLPLFVHVFWSFGPDFTLSLEFGIR
jgi:hypothetical protein